jgi:hypothetical protein
VTLGSGVAIKMVEIADISEISHKPSRWEGTTVDGEELYIKYAWGELLIELDGETVFQQEIGSELDTIIGWEEIEDILMEL